MGPREAGVALELLGDQALRPVPLRHVPAADRHARRAARAGAGRRGRSSSQPGETIDGLRERWFGATGRRVPEIAVEGELELGDALVLDDVSDEAALQQAHERGPAGRRARATRAEDGQGGARPARGRVACSSRPTGATLLDLDLTGADLRLSPVVATYSIAACDLDAGAVGRRDAVEVPRRRLGRPVGGAAASARSRRRRTRTRATGRTGSRCCARALSAEEVVERLTAADDGRDHRQLGVVDGQGGGATLHRRASAWTGPAAAPAPCYAAQGNILVSAETVDALADDVRARPRAAARRAPARLPRRGAGGRRRPPRPAVGGAARRRAGRRLRGPLRRRSSTCASTTTSARSRSCARLYGMHQALFGKTPREDWLDVDDALARGAARAARAARLRRRARRGVRALGRAARTSRSASTASSGSTRSCSRS